MDILSSIFTPDVVSSIAEIVLALLSLLASAMLAAGVKFVRTKTTQAQFDYLQSAAAIIVDATEQLGVNGVVEDKKGHATQSLSDLLASKGIKVPAADINHAIEAAVLDGFNRGEAVPDADVVAAVPGN